MPYLTNQNWLVEITALRLAVARRRPARAIGVPPTKVVIRVRVAAGGKNRTVIKRVHLAR
jgi:hypothetical protein